MSSAQTDILNAIDTRIEAVLGSEWNRMKYSYELEKNDYRTVKTSYGSGVLAGSTSEGTTNAVTMDQSFFVVLATNYTNVKSDSSERTAINTINDNLELLYRDVFTGKMGTVGLILTVSAFDLDEPERPADNVIAIRATFTVKHRKATT